MDRNINLDIFMKKSPAAQPEVEQQTLNSEVLDRVAAQKVADDVAVFQEGVKAAMEQISGVPTELMKDRGDGSVNVIEMNGITQIFNEGEKDEYKLFENFDFVVPDIPGEGQLVSIMGASGCGKSRLVRAICGLDTMQAGTIKIYGQELQKYAKNVPMVFQTYSNYEWMTVLENVMLPMRIRGVKKAEAEKKAMALLEVVGLSSHADKYPSKLSGGQQQRVSIARSLACDSQIIVFDEATGALDIKMKREVQNIILKIFYETPMDPTILNITHSIEEAAYVSNMVYIMKPNPCQIYKKIDVHYPGEETKQRGEWVFDTPEYAAYVKEITQAMDEVCR